MANEILFLAVRGSEIPNDDVQVGALRSGLLECPEAVVDAGKVPCDTCEKREERRGWL